VLLAVLVHGRLLLPARRDIPRLLFLATIGIALNQACFLEGLARSTPMNAGLVICLIPVFTFVVAAVVRQERFSGIRAFGVLVACAGAVPLFLGEGAELLGEYGFGNLLLVVNSFFYAWYLVLSKPLVHKYPPLVVIAWMYTLSLVYLPYFLFKAPLLPEDVGSGSAWGALGYILVFPTIVGYLFNAFALSRVRASTTAVYIYMQPIITGVASWFMLGERLTPDLARAAVLLFVGVWLVTRQPAPILSVPPEHLAGDPPPA
jgi:drug/metabolite transporter (DMT)-like permease